MLALTVPGAVVLVLLVLFLGRWAAVLLALVLIVLLGWTGALTEFGQVVAHLLTNPPKLAAP